MARFRYTPNVQGLQTAVEKEVKRAAAFVWRDAVSRLVPGYGYDTGNLARSYRMSPALYRNAGVQVQVGTAVAYAPFVEFGTYKMSARPHLRPALNAARAKYGGYIA